MKNGSVKQVYSQKLGRKVDLWVLDTPNPKGLIYMMHGNGGDCLEWEENTNIAQLAAQYGLAVVSPDFEDSYCTNTADGRPWFDYLTQELPALTQELLGRSFDPANTYIAGLSAGAYGALKWAFACPGSFAACAALSAVTDMAARIALLPAHAIVVNVGRCSAIDQDALIDALNSGRLAGAALDVMVPEPLPADHPLWTAKNILITPHISGNMSLGITRDLDVDLFCRDLANYAAGRPLQQLVDRKLGY